ncbi:MAG: type II/IV secretion system protein [Pseudomonadota bacterium]|nr:type II/IV secretion system protein [Pseudomonadota bacterium]
MADLRQSGHAGSRPKGGSGRQLLGEALTERGIISGDQLRIALIEQRKQSVPLGKLLVSLGFVSEATVRDMLSESLGQVSIDLANTIADPSAIALIPREVARRHHVLPVALQREENRLVLAVSDPNDVVALDQIRVLLREDLRLETVLARDSDITAGIEQYYGFELSIDGILHEIETGEIDYQSLQSSFDEYSQPVVRLIDSLLNDAAQQGASDIHFEPEQGFLRIRYRIDGVLRQIRSLHKNYWPAMVVRLKIMSRMNIAETRAPQDGRFSLTVSGHPIDFRVSTQLTTHGENIVLRILDRQKGIVPLERLNLPDEDLRRLKLMIARPEGMILVTGPTGSGKTTTLYSILNRLNTESVNIMTLEEPVEYPMPLIRQTSVNEAAKMDFANGIRSMMRQDPDVILVGEIRDRDTAEMAFRAAMTGHQVYTTLHTNSAIGVVPRLLDLGVLPDIMAGNIIGVVAQRLVRLLCTHCRQPVQIDESATRLLGRGGQQAPRVVWRSVGCRECSGQGYRGRRAIMELLKVDADIDELIARRATAREIRQVAISKGFQPLVEQGLRLVRDGLSSLSEVSRVVDLTDLVD